MAVSSAGNCSPELASVASQGDEHPFAHGAADIQTPRPDVSDPRCMALRSSSTIASAPQTARGDGVRVRVASRVRPLLPFEAVGARQGSNCVEVASPSVFIGKSCFTFDHVFGPEASQEEVYEECVSPLVEATFDGVNGTLLAYGQTGSGKTYTMGTSGLPSVPEGALQRAIRRIFSTARERASDGTTNFRVSFAEIFTDSQRSRNAEEIRDLLTPGRSQFFASIKTDLDGQVRMEGVDEHEVWTEQEALTLLGLGSAARATASTRMNDSSSRSHAIFSIEVIQRRLVSGVPSTLTAKFQFVDLAGSEKIKASGAEGDQLSQAININHGLFVLGKVITALTEGHPHVPFRESKLTRILQNSLGGNSRTCMVACVSPSDSNLAETISTLTYAAKAKEIRNKPVVNRGLSCPSCAILQAKLDAVGGSMSSTSIAGPPSPVAAASSKRQERFSAYVVELEKENVNLRQENSLLREEASYSRNQQATSDSGKALNNKLVEDAKTAAIRAESLYKRCSEKLAALQQAVKESELNVDDMLMCPEDYGTEFTMSDIDDGTTGDEGMDQDAETVSDGQDADDDELAWMDQEARRKQRLLFQVEENHHAMAVLEAQSKERIKQHEAARDIAERELERMKAELEQARHRAEKLEKFRSLQERYDKRLASLKERNTELEKEKKEGQRLRTLQQRQETRIRVLQDSIRQVKDDRDRLRANLKEEVSRRRNQEANQKRERKLDQEKIKSLSKKLRFLERPDRVGANMMGGSKGGHSASTRSLRRSPSTGPRMGGSAAKRLTSPGSRSQPNLPRVNSKTKTRSNSMPAPASAPEWDHLLQVDAERALRDRRLEQAKAQLADIQAQVLEASARRERLAVETEVEGDAPHRAAELEAVEAELKAQEVALEYHQEQVWLLRRERDACEEPEGGLAAAAAKIGENHPREELIASLGWLCSEAARQCHAAALAREAQEASEADFMACRAALSESEHRATEMEHSFDVARGDYESRVAFLLTRLDQGRQVEPDEVREGIGEEATALLTRRVGELETALIQERKESQAKAQRRIEQDMELITSCREQDSENKELRMQLKEAKEGAERAVTRGAAREAQLLRHVEKLEQDLNTREQPAPITEGAESVEVSWVMESLEEFWRSTGLDVKREELIKSLRLDVEHLCKQRLQDYMQWKQDQEDKNKQLQRELEDLGTLLAEEPECPPEDANLLQVTQHMETNIRSLTELKEIRSKELADLSSQIAEVHWRLREAPVSFHLPNSTERGALEARTIEQVRERLRSFENLEKERQQISADRVVKLHQLWAVLGVEVPEGLDAQELTLVQGPPPVSDAQIAYLDARYDHLLRWRDNLEPEESSLQAKLAEYREQCQPFGSALSLPEVPAGLPLLPCIKALAAAVQEAEYTARGFVREQCSTLKIFYETSRLDNVAQALGALEGTTELQEELSTLRQHWERLTFQQAEYHRIFELISSREALESQMRRFDTEASKPDRFRQRGYSGVQENKIRADYKRRLSMLDSSMVASMSEWMQREGDTFRINGVEYRGADLLPSEHTHMYAWTGKQVAQAQKLATSPRSNSEAAGLTMESPVKRLTSFPMDSTSKRSPASPGSPRQDLRRSSPRSTPMKGAHSPQSLPGQSPRLSSSNLNTARSSLNSARTPQSARSPGGSGSVSARRQSR